MVDFKQSTSLIEGASVTYFLVVALLACILVVLRAVYKAKPGNRRVNVREVTNLDRKTTLSIVEIDSVEYVILNNGHFISMEKVKGKKVAEDSLEVESGDA